jgi:hypothetical protein
MKKIEIKSWRDFRSWIDNDRQVLPVYWRGQKNPDWPLASRFERYILEFKRNRDNIWKPSFYQAMRDRYLDSFKRACSGLRGASPAELDTDQWWALGRHYGLITPLLDWTESPYIAAFFPMSELYAEMNANGGPITFKGQTIAIYRLFHNESLEGDGLRVVRPTVDELGRMQGQRGLFTWLDSEEFFELQGFLDNTGRSDLLHQFVISDQALIDGLHDLKAHGIDWRLLYPDLTGAAKQANSQWDLLI